MKPAGKRSLVIFFFLAGMISILPGTLPAAAADAQGDWRKTYDLVLMWINFGIFVFFIARFLRVPLKKFIAGKQSELERKISRLEEEKNGADQKLQDILRAVDESRSEFEALKQRIMEQGEVKKEAIIKDARQKSQVMVREAQLRVENQIHRARKELKDELVDAAVDLALEKFPQIVTESDNHKLIQDYIAGAAGK